MLTVEVVGNSAAEMPGFVDRAIGGEGVGAGGFVRQLETRPTE
ncbi:hypothetical protein FOXYSP1_20756 [Fusarium oxysporum f. sp. phaseoli]